MYLQPRLPSLLVCTSPLINNLPQPMAELLVFHDMTVGLWAGVPGVTMGFFARSQISITFDPEGI